MEVPPTTDPWIGKGNRKKDYGGTDLTLMTKVRRRVGTSVPLGFDVSERLFSTVSLTVKFSPFLLPTRVGDPVPSPCLRSGEGNGTP